MNDSILQLLEREASPDAGEWQGERGASIRWSADSLEAQGLEEGSLEPDATLRIEEGDHAALGVQLSRSTQLQPREGARFIQTHVVHLTLRCGAQRMHLRARASAAQVEGLPALATRGQLVALDVLVAVLEACRGLGATVGHAAPAQQSEATTLAAPRVVDVGRLVFSEDRAPICVGDRWGFVDSRGRLVTELVYDEVAHFSEQRAAVRVGDHWGYVSHEGALVIPTTFIDALPFSKGLGVVRREYYGWFWIAPTGQLEGQCGSISRKDAKIRGVFASFGMIFMALMVVTGAVTGAWGWFLGALITASASGLLIRSRKKMLYGDAKPKRLT